MPFTTLPTSPFPRPTWKELPTGETLLPMGAPRGSRVRPPSGAPFPSMIQPPAPPPPFIARLAELQSVASPQHRQIMEVLLQDALYGALWGIEEMASRTGTSVTTIMRLAKYLGFPGFSEFRNALKEACESRASAPTPDQDAAPAGPLGEVAHRDAQNVRLLLQEASPALLERAVDLILKARTRLLLGRGTGGLMAEILSHHLIQAGCPCMLPGSMPLAHHVANLQKEDLLAVFSTAPYSVETTDAVAYARECGVPILVFADAHLAPEARKADLLIRIPCENVQQGHSLAPFAMLAYALSTMLSARDQTASALRRKAAEQISGAVYLGSRGGR